MSVSEKFFIAIFMELDVQITHILWLCSAEIEHTLEHVAWSTLNGTVFVCSCVADVFTLHKWSTLIF